MRRLWTGAACVVAMMAVGACGEAPTAPDPGPDAATPPGASTAEDGDTSDMSIETIRDVTFNVEGFDTYAWVGAAAAVRDPDREWTPSGLDVSSELMFLVDRELRNRGRSQVVTDPKMVALFAIGLDMKALDVSINPESDVTEFESSPKAGILVLLVHPRTRYVVWAGRAVGDAIKAPTIEGTKARLEHAVTKMFESFPD